MNTTSRLIAEEASFDAFINCYLREVDAGEWLRNELASVNAKRTQIAPYCIELHLPEVKLSLRLNACYRSLVGRHQFTDVYTRSHYDNATWQVADKFHTLIAVIQNIYLCKQKTEIVSDCNANDDHLKIKEAELLARLYDSYQLMTLYIDSRQADSTLQAMDFISSEQSSLYGHWLHPTPKSRQGMSFWQQQQYSPELQGYFKLHYFSVDKCLITQGSALSQSAAAVILDDVKKHHHVDLKDNHILIPQHPLQAQYLLLNPEVRALINDQKIDYLGELGTQFTPTSSVRTVFSESSEWMYKFSIPVKITNSLRCNKRDELEDGMEVEKYLRSAGFFKARPQFKMIDDPAYITVNLPSQPDKESGFEVVLRRNIVYNNPNNTICSILALVQDPIASTQGEEKNSVLQQHINQLALKENRTRHAVAHDWFSEYFTCSIDSLIILYDTYGIALEAHQQNSLLDISSGYPTAYYYRDNQGFYLSQQYADTLQEIDDSLSMSEMFYDDEKIFEAMSHYLFFNQLFAVIQRLGADGCMTEKELLVIVRLRLAQLQKRLTGIGKQFIDYILKQDAIAYKTNLQARINDIDELHQGMETAIYMQIENPLVSSSHTHQAPIITSHASEEVSCYAC